MPHAAAHGVEAKLLGDLRSWHCAGKVLLVCKDEDDRRRQLRLVEHALELSARVGDTLAVVGVHNENEALRVLIVVPPERANLVLTCAARMGAGGTTSCVAWMARAAMCAGCQLNAPPTSQTVKLMFLYSTLSTLNPGANGVRNEEWKYRDHMTSGEAIRQH